MPRLKLPKERIVEVPARIWKRALAFIIDLIIIDSIILYPFENYLRSALPAETLNQGFGIIKNPIQMPGSIIIMISLLFLLYFSLSGYYTGTTAGRLLFRIKIKNQAKEKRIWQFLVSNITFTAIPILWLIDFIYLLVSAKKQRLMERLGKLESIEEVSAI